MLSIGSDGVLNVDPRERIETFTAPESKPQSELDKLYVHMYLHRKGKQVSCWQRTK